MSIAYNSITGIQGDPLTYISELASAGKQTLDSTGTMTRLIILVALVVILILYYILFYNLGKNGSVAGIDGVPVVENSGKRFLEILLWSIFIILIIINGFQYFFNVNVTAEIKDLFSEKPEIDLTIQQPEQDTPVPELKLKKEVFHIPGNNYTYEDSKAICEAYGAELANYSQIEGAYNKGAEWCSYGWSKDQMALFPTQQKTWETLQKIEGHEHDCGRPGINGGFINNPNVRFGVNCYGYKPFITPTEATSMSSTPIYPQSLKDIEKQKKLEYWKKKIPEILISPFNHDAWSILG